MARARFAALLMLLLAACSREGATGPFADARTPPDLGPRFFTPEGWAWGYVEIGRNPPQRYGVATTWRVPRANVVVLPGHGESAETWFETVRALNRSGYTVWILDRASEGGSGRYALPRDLAHVPSFDPDVAALKSLVRVIIRPRPGTPLILMGHGAGAVVALRAAETGLVADGLVLSSPDLPTPPSAGADLKGLAARLPGLDRLPSSDWRPWGRGDPDDRERGLTHDPWRGAVTKAWQTANPDLRLSGTSLGWRRALVRASETARAGAVEVRAPVLMLTAGAPQAADAALCHALAACRTLAIPQARPALHLEADRWRAPWFAGVSAFLAAQVDQARAVKPSQDDGDSDTETEGSEDFQRSPG